VVIISCCFQLLLGGVADAADDASEGAAPGAEQQAVPNGDLKESSEAQANTQEGARETLRLARLRFERGEYEDAVEAFATILGSPVRLATRRELHEGFLYYSFTLFLQGNLQAAEKGLETALRLDPEFAPSPVTTRPDLLEFYESRQTLFVAEQGGIAEAPETIFPELAGEPGSSVVSRRQRFVPLLGIGLRQLGHPRLGNGLLGAEIGAFSINIASLILRAAYIEDRTPKGMTATGIAREVNYTSFGIFWGALLADFIVSMALRSYYKRNPDKRRSGGTLARRYDDRRPQVRAGPSTLTLAFW